MPSSTGALRRAAIILLAFDWAIAFVLTLGMMFSWLAEPAQAPKGPANFLYGLLVMFSICSLSAGVILVVLAGVPWAILHRLGARSFWVAPATGFVVAFAVAFHHTYSIGHPDAQSDMSMSAFDAPIMTHGRLTPYGETLYGTEAAVWSGVALGLVGASFASVLWWLAYPRRLKPTSPSAPRSAA